MGKIKYLSLLGLAVFLTSCNYTGTPVEYANMCDKANDEKMVEVAGFLDASTGAMCSNSTGPMKCGIRFKEKTDSEKFINADVILGSWSSEVEEVDGKGLKIRDNKSEFVEKTEKVKLTAEVRVHSVPVGEPKYACYISVYKIEKAQ